jgi:cysteine dioxygenase
VKVLQGEIQETKYAVLPDEAGKLQLVSEVVGKLGEVLYMDDSVGLHKIKNPNPLVGAISLHLYTPPYQSCKVS